MSVWRYRATRRQSSEVAADWPPVAELCCVRRGFEIVCLCVSLCWRVAVVAKHISSAESYDGHQSIHCETKNLVAIHRSYTPNSLSLSSDCCCRSSDW